MSRQWLLALRRNPWPTRMIPMHYAPAERVFAELVRQHIFVALIRAFVESLTSENAARLSSMQVAEKNIGEHLKELRMQFNRQRQSAITAELLDIVAGFEALKK